MKRTTTLAVGAASVLTLTLSLSSCAQLAKTTGLSAGQTLVIAGETWNRIEAARAANAASQSSAKDAVDVEPVATLPPVAPVDEAWWKSLLPW